jgi:hypothetical protein
LIDCGSFRSSSIARVLLASNKADASDVFAKRMVCAVGIA